MKALLGAPRGHAASQTQSDQKWFDLPQRPTLPYLQPDCSRSLVRFQSLRQNFLTDHYSMMKKKKTQLKEKMNM